jgi:hypothetical protein
MNTSTNRASNEMFFQLIALLLAIIIVHTIFVTVVRPNADSTIRHHAEMVAGWGRVSGAALILYCN